MASSVKHSLHIPARAPRGTCDWLACCRHSCQGSPSVLINAIDLPKSCLPRQLGALLAQPTANWCDTVRKHQFCGSAREIWQNYIKFTQSSEFFSSCDFIHQQVFFTGIGYVLVVGLFLFFWGEREGGGAIDKDFIGSLCCRSKMSSGHKWDSADWMKYKCGTCPMVGLQSVSSPGRRTPENKITILTINEKRSLTTHLSDSSMHRRLLLYWKHFGKVWDNRQSEFTLKYFLN